MSDSTITASPPTSDWPALAAGRPIWTGHQPRFWHPGILAKYVAADQAMTQAGDASTPLNHIVVDQDVQDPLSLDVPVQRGDALTVSTIKLGPTRLDVPTGRQPSVAIPEPNRPDLPDGTDPRAAAGVQQIVSALRTHADQPTLARQVTRALHDLLAPHLTRPLASHFATDLQSRDDFKQITHHLLHDAQRAVHHYNRAAARDPGAGIAPLHRDPHLVELPLWHIPWNAPRQRVYADLADTIPLLTLEDGTPLDDRADLAPRALLMTALLRSRRGADAEPACGLFVHGTGGGRYDTITERWWAAWQNQPLAPIAVATADRRLSFDAPVGTPHDHRRAVWRAHHLPHNPDRVLGLSGPLVDEKQHLLAHMHDDRDKPRRRAAFQRLHDINAELRQQHPQAIEEARAAVRRARQGVSNATIAQRRDWPFVFFDV